MARSHYTRLEDFEKGMIIAFFWLFGSIAIVTHILGRPWSTIKNFLLRVAQRDGDYHDLPRPGHPRKLTKYDRRRILRAVRRDRHMTREEFRRWYTPHVSLDTLDLTLRKMHIKKWRAAKRIALAPELARERLEWALAHRDWTLEDWKRAVWSDEYMVEKSKDPRVVWIFRSPHEKWVKDCIQPVSAKRVKLMVWKCFYGNTHGTFSPIIVKSFNSKLYMLLLQYLVPVMTRISKTLGTTPLFMQDNSKVHTAERTKEWLADMEYQLEVHPRYSPDLNPIEHVWKEMGQRLQEHYSDIKDTPGGTEKVKARLAEVLPLVWDSIPEEFLDKLWRLMLARVEVVIEARGWYAKY